jgi:tetratricopeptide (TPR) repeat protein
LQTGKIDEAMALFERTYHLAPEKSAFYLASGCNEKAYQYAKTGDYTKAIETIDRAIALMPNKLNYYESKGEILLMKGEEQEAVKMWQKVIEIDPEFLQKYEGGTDFYKQLKERGLLK